MKKINFTLFIILFISTALTAQWKRVYGGSTNSFIIYQMVEHQGYIFAATNGAVIRSSDRGETWESTNTGGFGASIESDGSRLFAGLVFASGGSTLVYSDDNGTTWNPTNITQSQISEIRVINSGLMYAYSNFQKFYKSTDRGETWEEMTGLPFTYTYSIFVTRSGRILIDNYYSDDNGETWQQVSGSVNTRNYYTESDEGIWMGGSRLYFSNDNGDTYQQISSKQVLSLVAVGSIILKGTTGFEYSTDGGETFVEYNEGIHTIRKILSMIYDGENILIGLDGPGIYKIKAADLGISTSVEQIDLMADDFHLYQNYPNPFNPSTKITFSIPSNSHVRLTVYNIAGQEVVKLIDEEMNIGKYSVDFNASNLSSGVYFYKLQADQSIQMNKMILIK